MLDSYAKRTPNHLRLTNQIYHLGSLQPYPPTSSQSLLSENKPSKISIPLTEETPNRSKPQTTAHTKPMASETDVLRAHIKNLETRYVWI